MRRQPYFNCSRRAPIWAAALSALLGLAAQAPRAEAINWDGGGVTPEWLEPANWAGNQIPTTLDSAVIFGSPAAITGTGVPAVQSVSVGAGSLAGQLQLAGTSAPANLTVLNNVAVAPAGSLTVGAGGPAPSELIAGAMNIAGNLVVQNLGVVSVAGNIVQTGGTVSINNGALSADNVLTHAGLFEAIGAVTADVHIGDAAGGVATLSAGAGIGTLTIDGNLELASDARLAVQFGAGPSGPRFDSIVVTGTASLGGVLDLSVLGALQPTPGVSYPVLRASAIDPDSRFDDIVGLPTGGGSWVPTFDLFAGVQVSYTVLPGDMNGDLSVDANDVERFAWAIRDASTYHQHFVLMGNSAFATMADLDFDGDLTFADIPIFLEAIELGGGSAAAASAQITAILSAVPEPSTYGLVLATAGFTCNAARRRFRGRPVS